MTDVNPDKPHHFEIVMNSYSDGVLNQEVIVREYAKTGAQLTAKQMAMTKDVIPAIVASFDTLSKPYQELGAAEMIAEVGTGKPRKKAS
jgi:hypothetical protein